MSTNLTIGQLTSAQRKQAAIAYRRSGMTVRGLCRHLGIKETCKKELAAVLRSLGESIGPGGRPRTYTLRDDAFEKGTDESAYWCGFLLADGYIHCRRGIGTPEGVRLALAPRDRGHVQSFLNFLGCDAPIKIIDREDRRQGWGRNQLAFVDVYSGRLAQSLVDLGVTTKKSLTARADRRLATNPHFWRGVVDGDGAIFVSHKERKTPQPILMLCSASKSLIDQFVSFCRLHVEFAAKPRLQSSAWYFRLTCKPAVQMLRVLYTSGVPALPRKAAKAASLTMYAR